MDRLLRKVLVVGAIALLVAPLWAKGSQEEEESMAESHETTAESTAMSYDVAVGEDARGAHILTDGAGMTLYYFTRDVAGESVCEGGCLENWPAFSDEIGDVADELAIADFGTITRADGTVQNTYKGWPLYYFVRDQKPGDLLGDGVNEIWYTVPAGGFSVAIGTDAEFGNYLVDGMGNSLYLFTNDSENVSVCTGDCEDRWPVFAVDGELNVPSALSADDFGTITRADGSSQTTYKGTPLYYFFRDEARGDVNGQGALEVWYLVQP